MQAKNAHEDEQEQGHDERDAALFALLAANDSDVGGGEFEDGNRWKSAELILRLITILQVHVAGVDDQGRPWT